MALTGNFTDNRAALLAGVENLELGFTAWAIYGSAAISVAAGTAVITDINGQPFTVPASAADPSYITYCSFYLPAGVVADAANRVLKLAPLATTAAGPTAASSLVSGASPFAYAAQGALSASVPGVVSAITAPTTFALFSTDGANAAAGTFAAVSGTIYADCQVLFLKRKRAIGQGGALRSREQAYKAAGVAAGSI